MELRVIREPSVPSAEGRCATLGALYVDDVWTAWTLEDELREVPGRPVAEWKIRGRTAIPAGRYRVRVTWSPKFDRRLPEIFDVPGFSAIRLHVGNRDHETEGCLLVGLRRASAAILESAKAVEALVPRLEAAETRGEPIWITVENPPSYAARFAA